MSARAWPAALIAVLALGRWAHAFHPTWPSELAERLRPRPGDPVVVEAEPVVEPHPYGEEARALLRGLDAGAAVGDWTVVRVEGPLSDRQIHITLSRAELVFVATLAPAGSQPHAAPVSVAGWDLFYGRVQAPHELDDQEYFAVLTAVAARISGQ
jgi:hypothetical protein